MEYSSTSCGDKLSSQQTSEKILFQTYLKYEEKDIHTFNGPFSGTTRVNQYQKGKNQSGFYWSKRQWVALVSAGPHASPHLAPDR